MCFEHLRITQTQTECTSAPLIVYIMCVCVCTSPLQVAHPPCARARARASKITETFVSRKIYAQHDKSQFPSFGGGECVCVRYNAKLLFRKVVGGRKAASD